MRALDTIAASLFAIALVLLPAAEWRSIVLPVSGKSLGFASDGQGSASPFDLVFLLFCIAIIPAGIRFMRQRRFLSPYLAHWLAVFALLGLMLATNEHALPFLTPAVRKVVDARSLLLHAAVMVAVTIYLSSLKLETLLRGVFAFCAASAVGLAVLSALAFAEFSYFRLHYPFANPTHVVFPFPTYNVAAIFVTVTCIGLVCSAYCLRKPLAIVLGVPAFLVAAALTGSRSNLFVLITVLAALAAVTLLAALRKQAVAIGLRRAAWLSAATVSLAAVALTAGYDWQPVQRAVSIFRDVARDPVVLLVGEPGSPRNEMWQLARSRADLSRVADNRPYSVILTSIRNGCVVNSTPLSDLEAGREYWLRLRQSLDPSASGAVLEVFADAAREDLVGRTSLALTGASLSHFSMYLADSAPRFVTHAGTVREFLLEVDGRRLTHGTPKIVSYFDTFNGAPGLPVSVHEDKIEVSAKDRKIRGFVNLAARIPSPARALILEYRLLLDHVTYTLPLDAPAMFYVGLHDTDPSSGDWTELRNALLIQHRRMTASWEEYSFVSTEIEHISAKFPDFTAVERRLELERLQSERPCAASGVYRVADVWKVRKEYDTSAFSFDNIYSGKVASRGAGDSMSPISLITDKVSWLPALQLKYGGSTHNVYLDWYYYESTAALALFLVFGISMVAVIAAVAWRTRSTAFGSLALGVCLQVTALLLLMYAQPYIWIKYFWVVFGVASALAIHPETRRHGGA